MRTRIIIYTVAICCVSALLYGAFQAAAPPPPVLSKLTPAGALLYIESPDLGSLLNDWNSSTEKQEWLKSSNYSVFSRSRLFLRLQDAQREFALAAGVPPDMKLLNEAAGRESALAIYDIGELHFVYVTHLPANSAMKSQLWQTRGKFDTRKAGEETFYLRKDAASGRVAAFALKGDVFIVGTREDLVAGALAMASGLAMRSVADENWFTDASAAAGKPGELRMLIHMGKVSHDPRFRTYWIQQNITEMQGYRSVIADLYRSGNEYREERVLLPLHPQAPDPTAAAAVAQLSGIVPADAGFYSISRPTDVNELLTALQAKVLVHNRGAVVREQLSPAVTLTDGATGASSDLETRIDQAPPQLPKAADANAELKATLEKAQVRALLTAQWGRNQTDGVFVETDSVLALLATNDWDRTSVKQSLLALLRPGQSAAELGLAWKTGADGAEVLDGLKPLAMSHPAKTISKMPIGIARNTHWSAA